MLMKAAIPFRCTAQPPGAADLETALQRFAARAPGPLEAQTLGFVYPGSGTYAYQAHGLTALALREERRVVPAYAIASRMTAAAIAFEREEQRPLRGADRRAAREQIVTALLAQALTTARTIPLLWAPASGWLVVGTASPGQAERCLARLREALGTLPARPWCTEPRRMSRLLKTWSVAPPDGIGVLDDQQWEGDDGSLIRLRGDVETNDVNALRRDRELTYLRLDVHEEMEVTVAASGRLTRIVWHLAPEDGDADLATRLDWSLATVGQVLINTLDLLDRHLPTVGGGV